MGNVMPLSAIKLKKHDGFLFDTNVWLYIQGPFANPSDWKTEKYSKFYGDLLRAECKIFVTLPVISEFINRYIRIMHDQLKKDAEAPERFKEFRQTSAYVDALTDAADDLAHIMGDCERINTDIQKIDFDRILETMKSGSIDLIDVIAADHCTEKDWVLVSHDRDFSCVTTRVATANPRLLRASS